MFETIHEALSNTLGNKGQTMKLQGEALIPTDWGDFYMKAYSDKENDPMPHFALISKELDFNKPINVRIHSECITGDIFKSNRCECGEQLAYCMDYISKNGGILIYLRQEGRGIGIINKLHAYVKQDQGYDTAQANEELGLDIDSRDYADAIFILKDLGIHSVNIMTNNPDKINAFYHTDITLIERLPVIVEPKADNEKYLDTKQKKFGHLLS